MKILCDSEGNYIKIDDEYLDPFCAWRWATVKSSPNWSKFDWNRFREEFLLEVILQAPKGSVVEYIDGDELNCQRANLREITQEAQRKLELTRS